MQDVIFEAVNRLINIDTPARIVAEFTEEKPDQFMLDTPDIYALNQILNELEIGKLLGFNEDAGIRTKWFKSLLEENNGATTLNALG